MPKNQPTIGTVARQVGVNVETIRYYQRIGLVEEPPKNGGFRFYSEEFVERLRFIRRAKQLGFSLKEITKLLEFGESNCGQVKDLLRKKHSELLERISQLDSAAEQITFMIRDCADQPQDKPCPIVPQRH